MIRETKNLEFKEIISKSYLKTVSAFANYNDGQIIFGVRDDGNVVGLNDLQEQALNIENQINDSISPQPNYQIKINDDNTITLYVEKGDYTPYLYNNKAFKRNDSSTIEVDKVELNRLVLDGMNLSFEELKSKNQNLTFNELKSRFVDYYNIENFNLDTLKTLRLFSEKNGFNNAANLLSDNNDFPGIDIVIFGNNINEIKKRIILQNTSILNQYYETLKVFDDEYNYDLIEYGIRKKISKVPFNAFREALANAIIHRRWDIKANIKLEMYNDRIVIHSPGGLESGLAEEDYLDGNFSLLRNEIIADIFHRLGIVEIFATGIKRIKESYDEYLTKPTFNIGENSITISLPIITNIVLNDNEKIVYDAMFINYRYKRSEIEEMTRLSKYVIIRTLKSLEEKNIIVKNGDGPSTTYYRKK